MATGPDLRIADADREAAAEQLREHFAQGRLTQDEFNQRLDATFAAKTRGDIASLMRDLPHARYPVADARPGYQPSGAAGTGWQQGSRRYGARRAHVGVMMALCWLLVFAGFAFGLGSGLPWPGRLAIVVAIIAAVRGLLRRLVWGGRRVSRQRRSPWT